MSVNECNNYKNEKDCTADNIIIPEELNKNNIESIVPIQRFKSVEEFAIECGLFLHDCR